MKLQGTLKSFCGPLTSSPSWVLFVIGACESWSVDSWLIQRLLQQRKHFSVQGLAALFYGMYQNLGSSENSYKHLIPESLFRVCLFHLTADWNIEKEGSFATFRSRPASKPRACLKVRNFEITTISEKVVFYQCRHLRKLNCPSAFMEKIHKHASHSHVLINWLFQHSAERNSVHLW